jgi:glycosyltransferase involved in cell wall biosynthesis
MRNLKRWFEQNPVDVAYVSMLKHDAYVVVGVGREYGFPVILRPEGAGPTGDIAWQSWGNFGRLIGLRCRDAKAFVAVSQSIEDELREAWRTRTMRPRRWLRAKWSGGEALRIVAIPNGVPVPEISWQARCNWRATPRATYIGRLAPEKGLDTLIEAWPFVRVAYPAAQLTLIGEGPQKADLEARAKVLQLALGPGQAIDLPGPTADPNQALREADLFILPSREEGMSIALLEAMALGIPIVASSIPGNQRVISHLEHGRLAPAGDSRALARVIIEQWDDFDRGVRMGCAARDRVSQEFSIDLVARRHLELFQEIVGRRDETQGNQSCSMSCN